MVKVLPGTSRAAFSFVTAHWASLLKISVMPMLLVFAIGYFQSQNIGLTLEFLASRQQNGGQVDPEISSQFLSSMISTIAFGVLAWSFLTWLFVRTVRFWKTGEAEFLSLKSGELSATFWTFLYLIVIGLLTFFFYVAVIIILGLLAFLFGSLLSAPASAMSPTNPLIHIALFASISVVLVLMMWFMYRFLVGLPGVALGERPHLFSDMWPLSKGETWGTVIRIGVTALLCSIPLFIIYALFSGPLMQDTIQQVLAQPMQKVTPEILHRYMNRMMPIQVAGFILQLPLIWVTTIILTEAYTRFRARG
jgi:hypothetical protein